MTQHLERLVKIGGPGLAQVAPSLGDDLLGLAGPLAAELIDLLTAKNGFYAFESALHVFSTEPSSAGRSLAEWNSRNLWIDEYQGLANGHLFFAEDVFGGQFCLNSSGVYQFDPETGKTDKIGSTLDDWAHAILDDYEVLTGYPLGHEWQRLNGAISPGLRLVPKTPFVAGGKFVTDNLFALESVEGMRMRGDIAVQIKDLPDGATIKLKVVD